MNRSWRKCCQRCPTRLPPVSVERTLALQRRNRQISPVCVSAPLILILDTRVSNGIYQDAELGQLNTVVCLF